MELIEISETCSRVTCEDFDPIIQFIDSGKGLKICHYYTKGDQKVRSKITYKETYRDRTLKLSCRDLNKVILTYEKIKSIDTSKENLTSSIYNIIIESMTDRINYVRDFLQSTDFKYDNIITDGSDCVVIDGFEGEYSQLQEIRDKLVQSDNSYILGIYFNLQSL